MKILMTLAALALTLATQAATFAQTPKLDGQWESDGIVISVADIGLGYMVKPILGDPGWKVGSLELDDAADAQGNYAFTGVLKTDAGYKKEVRGKVVKSDEKLTIQFDASTELKQLSWTPATGTTGGTTIRVFCEAGYVAWFKGTWDEPDGLGGYRQASWSSSSLTAGQRDKKTVPVGSRNVKVTGYMIAAGDREINTMNVNFDKEYKVYGTIFSPQMVEQ